MTEPGHPHLQDNVQSNVDESTREGLPTPCLGCGAPMTATVTTGLHGDPTLSCHFCGRSETMPAEAAAQDRFLRLRLLQVRRAREAIEAPLKTFAMVRQTWSMALGVFVLMGGWQVWQAVSTAGKAPLESPLFALLGASGVLGVLFGYAGMVRAFRQLVKPQLLARPPLSAGLKARCRGCGAELPPVRAAQVQCKYCGADNFLDAALARDVGELLAAEQAQYQRRAQGEQANDGFAFQQPARAFYRWLGAGAGATFVVGLLVVLLLLR